MARISLSMAIRAVRADEMELIQSISAGHFATLIVSGGDQVWFALGRGDADEARAQAEAMDRLAELAGRAAAWLRGGDLPEQAGGTR